MAFEGEDLCGECELLVEGLQELEVLAGQRWGWVGRGQGLPAEVR